MATPTSPATLDTRRAAITSTIDRASAGLRELSLAIHSRPELNFEEHQAHALLTDYLAAAGFAVTRGAYDLPTAFRATAGAGSPTIAVFCEYDALPGIGHACGHNLIAISGVATALALKEALGSGEGTVLVLGSPAEEGGGGKVLMLERGALDGVDAALALHPAPGESAWCNLIARDEVHVSYHGRNAHAGASPWAGVNALDALVQAYNSISAMRQQMRPTDRVHGVITKGGDKPNIIPDHTAAEFYIRSRNARELEDLRAKVLRCFEGAAISTGCTVDIRVVNPTYLDVVSNDAMAERYSEAMQMFEVILPPKQGAGGIAGASSDMGNVSYAVPTIHPTFAIPCPPGVGNHTPGFTAAAATPEAHHATIRASKALAFTALDLYFDPHLLEQAKSEFAAFSKGEPQ
ncbi:MAG: M20 family metallopeptidase [Dehalococcoidia bacterium]